MTVSNENLCFQLNRASFRLHSIQIPIHRAQLPMILGLGVHQSVVTMDNVSIVLQQVSFRF